MTRAERIREALAALSPTELSIVDDSARHAGHAGASAAGETHFIVTIVSPAFAGRTRIERQRMVYQLVDAELRSGLHALQLTTQAPGEPPAPRPAPH
jgi:BolA protein